MKKTIGFVLLILFLVLIHVAGFVRLSTTAIHSEVASILGLWERTKGYSTVADGRKIDTEKAYLDYIQVGPIKIKNFQVSIINYSGNNDNYTGLLGMNFLKRVGYTIDYSRQIIKWE